MNNTIKWTGAIVLSLLAHAGTAKLFEPSDKPPEMAMVEGGEEMDVAVLGNAFEETILSGDPEQTEEIDEIKPEEVEPEPVDVAEIPPIQSDVTAETPPDVIPTEADVILPAEELPPVAAEQPEITATVAPAETVIPEEKPEPEPEEIKPEPEKKPEPRKEPEKEKPKKKPVKKKAGDKGNQVESAKQGQADGAENAAASSNAGKKGKVSQALGNAAESNYKGKVRSKVQRHFKYPKSADRAGVKGTVTVAFTVSASGGVSGVRIVKGSGSPVLDEAALNAVRKAEPLPKIPEGAGRSSWPFVLPLQFGRR
ncbi:MAG TPA: TonB family protein [Pararhizobium sp.]|uniref:energy transducer TonB family protein n=1 Tax=Pararhizobium sp. TaxID=1977563 RepID=UPI002BE83EBA|nr:TonB family protein [Pararhizobium sp.]HTO34536.1 TonB family protein [Pararhizobium sp.]